MRTECILSVREDNLSVYSSSPLRTEYQTGSHRNRQKIRGIIFRNTSTSYDTELLEKEICAIRPLGHCTVEASLALGQDLVGAPVGGVAAAGRVVLVQQAVTDGHSGMSIRIAVDVEDEDVSSLTTVEALAGLVPALVEESMVKLGHPAQIVTVIVGVAGQTGEGSTSVSSHGRELRAPVVRVAAAVTVCPVHGRTSIVAAGGGTRSADAALNVGRTSTVASQRVSSATRALTSRHAFSITRRGVAVIVGAALDVRRT